MRFINKNTDPHEIRSEYIRKDLFPPDYLKGKLSRFIDEGIDQVRKKIKNKDFARIPGDFSLKTSILFEKKYSPLPENGMDPSKLIRSISNDFSSGIPLIRSPQLQYNVGAAANIAAVAAYTIGLNLNICAVNEGSAGASLYSEKVVTRILSDIAAVDPEKSCGLFTFGGTATNMYAIKVATRRACPQSGIEGVPQNIQFLTTEDAHYSHAVAIDWLGIGTKNIHTIATNPDRTSSVRDAENKIRKILDSGKVLGGIILNGGTTYDHAVDDIPAFIDLRDRIVKEYSLPYIPHIHVDSVIGWAWLMFKNYDFRQNQLKFNPEVLRNIQNQYARISNLRFADSWGIDFHKGVGGCPIPCSLVIMNDREDFMRLSKKVNPMTETHQIAQEFNFESPSDYTLETSRTTGAPLAALTALHTMGTVGYQAYLGNLISLTYLFRKIISESSSEIIICNPESLGYVTMIRIYPQELSSDPRMGTEINSTTNNTEFVNQTNAYMKEFFVWDCATRMQKNSGIEYSYSSTYIKNSFGVKISALKFYMISPHTTEKHIRQSANTLLRQKKIFDMTIWKK